MCSLKTFRVGLEQGASRYRPESREAVDIEMGDGLVRPTYLLQSLFCGLY